MSQGLCYSIASITYL